MHGFFLEDLTIGQRAETVHTVEEGDLERFAAVSGDTNPMHMDEVFAAKTLFKGRIAHGMLSGAYISAVLGCKLPGPGAIYISQTLQFKRPVRIGDELTTSVEVTAIDERRGLVTLKTVCSVNGKTVVQGEAVVQPPKRSQTESAAA